MKQGLKGVKSSKTNWTRKHRETATKSNQDERKWKSEQILTIDLQGVRFFLLRQRSLVAVMPAIFFMTDSESEVTIQAPMLRNRGMKDDYPCRLYLWNTFFFSLQVQGEYWRQSCERCRLVNLTL